MSEQTPWQRSRLKTHKLEKKNEMNGVLSIESHSNRTF